MPRFHNYFGKEARASGSISQASTGGFPFGGRAKNPQAEQAAEKVFYFVILSEAKYFSSMYVQ